MIERHCDDLDESCARELELLPADQSSSPLKASILGVLKRRSGREDVGAALLAAAANNPALLDGARARYAEHIAQVTASGGCFARSAVIMLAIDGLMLGEVWRLTPFTEEQRELIVKELLRLADEACTRDTDAEARIMEAKLRRYLTLTLLAAAGSIAGCGDDTSAQMTPPPPEVVVTSVQRGEVPIELTYSGRTAGSREVEVRARVSGILLQRMYEEGKRVREGEVLFRIDPEPFRAEAAQARAELAVATAQRDEARRNRDRLVPLFEKSAVSRRERDAAVSAFEIGEANVAAAEARLRTAQLELGYTEVRAPIAGLASREERSEGSLVTAGEESSLLTRIVQTDPLYVEFSIAETEAALLRGALTSNQPADGAPHAR